MSRRRQSPGRAGLWPAAVLAGLVVAAGSSPAASEQSREATVTESTPTSITEFDPGDGDPWRAVDDVVMGGVSGSRLRLTATGTGIFEGAVSLDNNGGFASVRRPVGPLDLRGERGLALRVRGDGQRYRLRLRTDDRFDGIAWQATFATEAGVWRVVALPFESFEPSYRGRRPPAAGPLDVSDVRQLGLMIADRQAGPFRLEIDWIRTLPGGGQDSGEGDGPVPPAATRISLD